MEWKSNVALPECNTFAFASFWRVVAILAVDLRHWAKDKRTGHAFSFRLLMRAMGLER